MKFSVLCATLTIGTLPVSATTIVYSSLESTIMSADGVLVGKLSKEAGFWRFQVIRPLKGPWKPGDRLMVYPAWGSFERLADLVGNDDFLFICNYDEDSQFLLPARPVSAALPNDAPSEGPAPSTLEEAIRYAEKVLDIPHSTDPIPQTWTIPVFPPLGVRWHNRPVATSIIAKVAPDWSAKAGAGSLPVPIPVKPEKAESAGRDPLPSGLGGEGAAAVRWSEPDLWLGFAAGGAMGLMGAFVRRLCHRQWSKRKLASSQ